LITAAFALGSQIEKSAALAGFSVAKSAAELNHLRAFLAQAPRNLYDADQAEALRQEKDWTIGFLGVSYAWEPPPVQRW
jgi:hypothetical protein